MVSNQPMRNAGVIMIRDVQETGLPVTYVNNESVWMDRM